MSTYQVGDVAVQVIEGDITEQGVDAIVNAANNDLLHGGGVAGVISRRGGPAIQEESNRTGGVHVGEAAITGGGNLKAKYVLHAASMRLGGSATRENVLSSMRHCFRLAAENGVRSIAIPAVGAGIARLPMRDCAEVMATVVREAAEQPAHPRDVRFVLFGEPALREFDAAFGSALDAH